MHTEVKHPCVQHKLTMLRDRDTGHKEFRELATEITLFLAYEALRDVEVAPVEVETPICRTAGHRIAHDILLVPILRAGVGMLDGVLRMLPTARVGFVGIYRDPESRLPIEYYQKLPSGMDHPLCIVLDPMLATGGSAVAAIDMLKRKGFMNIRLICIVACPEGIAAVESAHPDVPVFTGSVDAGLNDHKYIVPGLGDAGDRLFGTR